MCLICCYTRAELEEVRPGILPLPALSTDNPRIRATRGLSVVGRGSPGDSRRESTHVGRRKGILSMLDIGGSARMVWGAGAVDRRCHEHHGWFSVGG